MTSENLHGRKQNPAHEGPGEWIHTSRGAVWVGKSVHAVTAQEWADAGVPVMEARLLGWWPLR